MSAHREVRNHAKGMLLEAKRAGEALLLVKEQCKHGEFEKWVKANTSVSPRQAQRYMQVAKSLVDERFDPDASIDSILDTNASRRVSKEKEKAKASQPFTKPDAEYAMKLHRMADSDVNENEAERSGCGRSNVPTSALLPKCVGPDTFLEGVDLHPFGSRRRLWPTP